MLNNFLTILQQSVNLIFRKCPNTSKLYLTERKIFDEPTKKKSKDKRYRKIKEFRRKVSSISRRSSSLPESPEGNNERVNFPSLPVCPPPKAPPASPPPVPVPGAIFFASFLSFVIGRLLMARDCLFNRPPPLPAVSSSLCHPLRSRMAYSIFEDRRRHRDESGRSE